MLERSPAEEVTFRLRLKGRVQVDQGKVSGQEDSSPRQGTACAKANESAVLTEE